MKVDKSILLEANTNNLLTPVLAGIQGDNTFGSPLEYDSTDKYLLEKGPEALFAFFRELALKLNTVIFLKPNSFGGTYAIIPVKDREDTLTIAFDPEDDFYMGNTLYGSLIDHAGFLNESETTQLHALLESIRTKNPSINAISVKTSKVGFNNQILITKES